MLNVLEIFLEKSKGKIQFWLAEHKLIYYLLIIIISLFGLGAFLYNFVLSLYHRNSIFYSAVNYTYNNRVIFLIFLWLAIISYLLYKNSKRLIKISLKNLNCWNCEGSWHLTADEDVFGNVLEVTNSGFGGVLKGYSELYDCDLFFKTKIVKGNFTFLVRASSNYESYCMLQVSKDHLTPHYFTQGIFLVDRPRKLSNKLEENRWIEVRVELRGNFINLYINNQLVGSFEIPNGQFIINEKKPVLSNSEWKLFSDASNEGEQLKALQEGKIIFANYNFGSIGFREAGEEKARFKDILIRPLV